MTNSQTISTAQSPGERRYEIGVDIGGTFTDVVCRSADGAVLTMKLPTTPWDHGLAVLESLRQVCDQWKISLADISRFTHGTTVATNAVLERKGARIGIITTAGFRDVLEIGRQLRESIYDVILEPQTPVFLAPRRMRAEVQERIASTGEILCPLEKEDVLATARHLIEQGAESIAIAFLFSFVNPAHERMAKQWIAEAFPEVAVSTSHEVDPAFREYERSVATAFDAYVKPTVGRYLENLEAGLKAAGIGCPFQVMQSRGGLTSALVARRRPVRLLLSGPAAGVIGAGVVGASAGARNIISIDIGGTSADIALVSDHKPMIRPEGKIGRFEIRVPMVDVNTIGAGGGSIARVDQLGNLRVGPDSAGSTPGPACYGKGGTDATVTDASIVLGYLDPNYFAGGSLVLDAAKAHESIERNIGRPLDLTPVEAAFGIHRILNAQMAEAIRLVSVRQGIDPRKFSLVPLGGAGGVHAVALAQELGMSRVVVPKYPGVLAAAGLLSAPIEHEVSTAFPQRIATLDEAKLRKAAEEIDRQASELMKSEQVAFADVTITHYVDVCYVGQSYTIEIPVNLISENLTSEIYTNFLEAHDRVYGHAAVSAAKLVNLRTVHRVERTSDHSESSLVRSDIALIAGERLMRVNVGSVMATVYNRSAIIAGFIFTGPAIVQQPDTTTIIEPGWSALADAAGNLILDRI
jgi:N-methylhydantoinase A